MLRTIVFGTVIAGALFVAPVADPSSAVASKAEAAGPRSLARRILRHQEHRLHRIERHHRWQIHREERQVRHIKRELHHLRK